MTSGADLFVVCKHCGSEVSPYITECPYCGHRLRRRAPKLPREGESKRARRGLLGRWASRPAKAQPAPTRARPRLGPIVVLALFLGAGATGALVAIAAYPVAVVAGGNAAALALLAAWAAPDLRAARAGGYYEGDLLGAGALAVLLLAVPFVRPEVSWLAGVTGGVLGLLVGLGLQRGDPAAL